MEKEREIIVVKEKYISVSESRIKNTIKEYRSGLPFSRIVGASFSMMVSTLIAFASYVNNNENVWKWVFLVLLIVSSFIFVLFGVISLAKKKTGKGTEEWFIKELLNEGHKKSNGRNKSNKLKRFMVINALLIFGLPTSILLLTLGLNEWNLTEQDWAPIFWVFWVMGTLIYLVFGTFINSFFSGLIFGYDPANVFETHSSEDTY